jgi:hypothetical protein
MEHSYTVNPFAGIICTLCKSVVFVKTTIFIALNQHEKKKKTQHPTAHTPEERREIDLQLKGQMKAIVEHVWHLSNDNVDLAINDLLGTYCLPCQPFHFCSICQRMVSDRRAHKRSRHCLACQETRPGCLIKDMSGNKTWMFNQRMGE